MPGGRPSKYDPKYCEEIIAFFDRDPYQPLMVKDEDGNPIPATNKSGDPHLVPCAFPTKEGFARAIGVHRDTIHQWQQDHEEFSDAIKKAEDIQKDILIQNALVGCYDRTFSIFVAKNVTDMRDKQELEHTSPDGSMSPKDSGAAVLGALARKHDAGRDS